MGKRIFCFAGAWLLISVSLLFGMDLKWEDISRGNHKIQSLLIAACPGEAIFAGVPGGIVKSEDGGESWRRVLRISSRKNKINNLVFSIADRNHLYAAADNGLYRSRDCGIRWERVYRGKSPGEERCLCVLKTSKVIFTGTDSGLFFSRDDGRSWSRQKGELYSSPVFSIDASPKQEGTIYLTAGCGVFRSLDSGENWERVYVTYSRKSDDDSSDEEQEEKEVPLRAHFIKVDADNPDRAYFSCTRGVYESFDKGKSWNALPEYGLLGRDVKMFCQPEGCGIAAVSGAGVFIFRQERWEELSFNLDAGQLNCIACDENGRVYAGGEKGVFRSQVQPAGIFTVASRAGDYLADEPDVRSLQKSAIEYAEVSPEKISRWRAQASKKALLPKFSIGLERNSTDLWHWETGSSAVGQSGDDLLRKGNENIDWDVTLSWDLGELIWNSDQTGIDSRSKLMVELRNDILDEVNKLYFERLRVKSELDNLSIENRGKRVEKQLKLAELTASLDSLTGGYYSEQMRSISSKQ